MSFIPVIKADFQHHYSSLQCHMILQKSDDQETFMIIINVENRKAVKPWKL